MICFWAENTVKCKLGMYINDMDLLGCCLSFLMGGYDILAYCKVFLSWMVSYCMVKAGG